MPNDSLYNRIVSFSPNVEMLARHVYHSISPLIKKKGKQKVKRIKSEVQKSMDFNKVVQHLKRQGLKEGDILVVHSSFSALKHFGLSPTQINNQLIEVLGDSGTLAMPAIQIYPNELQSDPLSIEELTNQRYVYDISSTRIWTGAMAKDLLKRKDSIRSQHPLNSMVAIGAKSKAMMEGNELDLYANGKNSSWNYCNLNSAMVVGLGTDLTHSLTMIHVAEDTKGEDWYIKDWYQDRKFILKVEDEEREINVKERRYKWGKYHFAERNLAKDLMNHGVMNSEVVEDTIIETLRADELIRFLDARNHRGYPYYWVNGNLKE